jgi:bifunctional non-homologous end joining protein LigD
VSTGGCDLGGGGVRDRLRKPAGQARPVVGTIKTRADCATVKSLAKGIAEAFASISRGPYMATVRNSMRTGKILIGYLRNGRVATTTAPYSLRARAASSRSKSKTLRAPSKRFFLWCEQGTRTALASSK